MTDGNGNTSTCNGVIIYTDKPQRCPTFSFFLSFSGLEQKHKQCPDLEAMLDTHIREHSSKQHIQRYIYTREEEARHDDDEGRRRLRREERRGGYRSSTGVSAWTTPSATRRSCGGPGYIKERRKGREVGPSGGGRGGGARGLLPNYLPTYLPTYLCS